MAAVSMSTIADSSATPAVTQTNKCPQINMKYRSSCPPGTSSSQTTTSTKISPSSCASCATTAARLPDSPFLSPPTDKSDLGDEDCLYLDIYVPPSAINNPNANLSVIVWFYGGAYIFGAKDQGVDNVLPLYKGYGLLEAAERIGEEVIFVAGNYRLGALRWLAGTAMEQGFTANAGLTDQRKVLEFVRDYINLFGGNPTDVSAWGESAGASSILHHLIAYNGSDLQTRIFRKAVVQSPAFQWQWDKAELDIVFTNFTQSLSLSYCAGYSGPEFIKCLQQNATSSDLITANQELWQHTMCSGVNFFGPAIDGILIKSLPALQLVNGEY
jgi:carboxylesterase type B